MPRREFPQSVQLAAFKRADGHCEDCGQKLFPGNCEYDHSQADFFNGEPTLHNCRCLCRGCHRAKTTREAPVMAKTRRREAKNAGIRKAPSRLRHPTLRKKLNGEVVLR